MLVLAVLPAHYIESNEDRKDRSNIIIHCSRARIAIKRFISNRYARGVCLYLILGLYNLFALSVELISVTGRSR